MEGNWFTEVPLAFRSERHALHAVRRGESPAGSDQRGAAEGRGRVGGLAGAPGRRKDAPGRGNTLPPTNMEVQKGPFREESGLSAGVCALPC